MSTPIIDPVWFYLMSLMNKLSTLTALLSVILFATTIYIVMIYIVMIKLSRYFYE